MSTGRGRTRLVAALVAVVTVASACGSSTSESDKAKRSVTDFFRAVADNEGTTACNLLTDSGVKELDAVAFALTAPGSCSEAVEVLNRQLGKDDKKALKGAKVNRVTVSGDHATVADNDIVLESGGRSGLFRNNDPKPLRLDKVGGQWKIASLGAA